MKLLYTCFTRTVPFFLRLLAPFNKKISAWLNGRDDWEEKFGAAGMQGNKCNVWFHCASLGEYEQGKPVMEALKATFPEVYLIVTFFSPSGYEARKNSTLANFVGYLPIDTPRNASVFLRLTSPRIAVFVKAEIWPNMIAALKERNIPTFLISARFYEGQSIFTRRGAYFRNQLKKLDFIFVQDQRSKKLLKKYGIYAVVSGDTRYDQVSMLPATARTFPLMEKFISKEPVLVVGSCWEQDLEVLVPYIHKNGPKLKVILAPHDVGAQMIQRIEGMLQVPNIRYSQMDGTTDISHIRVVIVDSIGMLAHLYRYATVAYVGGAFKQGLHNILEPASYGVPVVFGPRTEGFPEAVDMIAEAGAYAVATKEQLEARLDGLLSDRMVRQKAGQDNAKFISDRKGGTEIVMASFKMLLTSKMGSL